ncbi:unnamed protein product [Somion occarium]|uniref:NADAR domain-containing protein n=1 Tax=Somion occarium TaxID=3059160 RepID=A0ABP1EBC5_9APHY
MTPEHNKDRHYTNSWMDGRVNMSTTTSTPTTPQTAIPIITSEEVYTSQPVYTIDQVDENPIQYRVEERRRTIYVTSNAPPDPHTVTELFKLAEISEGEVDDSEDMNARRRTKSLEEREFRSLDHVLSGQEDKAESPKRLHRRSGHGHRKQLSSSSRHSYTRNTPPNTPTSHDIRPRTMIQQPPILFYHKHEPHYGFTNFSPHEVIYNGKRYPTSEHLFQSFKFEHKPNLAEHIRTCSDHPSVVFSEARRFQPEVRSDWMNVNIRKMDEALYHKFTQHRSLYDELLSTGDAELIENSDKDAFWGCGADGKGRNELGKALVRLRTLLRDQ